MIALYAFIIWGFFLTYKPRWQQRLRIGKAIDALFWIRLVGAVAYFVFAYYLSNGSVDAFVYDNWGTAFADSFAEGDFSPLFDESQWRNGQFLGTNFVGYPNALFFLITVYDTLTTYYLFSLAAWLGIMVMLVGVAKQIGGPLFQKALWWMVLIPSLWFWNSAIGKDAFSFLGAGLVAFGVAHKQLQQRILWIGLGVAVSYFFRQPFGLLLLMAVGASVLFDRKVSNQQRAILAGAGVLVLLLTFQTVKSYMGVQSLEAAEVNAQLESMYQNTNFGGGVIESKTFSPQGIVQSYIDVFLRPFPWEIRSVTYLLAFVETALVALLLYRMIFRMQFVRQFREDNLFRFFVVSTVLFGLAVGLTEVNIGIILRHRSVIHLFVVGAYILVASKQYHRQLYTKQLRMQYIIQSVEPAAKSATQVVVVRQE